MSKFLMSAAVCSVLVFGASSALAETPSKTQKVETSEADEGYGYKFEDDLLNAGVMGANSGTITIRTSIVRRTLIRPRTHFVPELLKSIELI